MNSISTKMTLLSFVLYVYVLGIAHLYRYNSLVDNFKLPGNIFNYVSLIMLFILLAHLLYILLENKQKFSKIVYIYIFFFLYILFYSILDYMNYTIISSKITESYFRFTYNVLISFMMYFVIGYYYEGYKKHYTIILCVYVLMTLNTWINIDPNTLYISFMGVAKEKAGLYQYLGDTYAIFSILLITLTNRKIIKFTFILITFLTLFVLMSRSSLYMYTIAIIFYSLFKYKKEAIVYLLLFVSFIGIIMMNESKYYEIVMNSRLLSFTHSKIDGSVAERIELAQVGFNAIYNNWFIGDYGGDVRYFHKEGKYIHNFLAVLRQFGFIPFLVYVYFIYKLVIRVVVWMRNPSLYSQEYDYFIVLSIFLILEVLIARSWTHAYIFLVIGMLSNLKNNNLLLSNNKEK